MNNPITLDTRPQPLTHTPNSTRPICKPVLILVSNFPISLTLYKVPLLPKYRDFDSGLLPLRPKYAFP